MDISDVASAGPPADADLPSIPDREESLPPEPLAAAELLAIALGTADPQSEPSIEDVDEFDR